DIFGIFPIPLLFRAHTRACIHNLALADKGKSSDTRNLTSRSKLDNTAVVWSCWLWTNENSQRVKKAAQCSQAFGMVVIATDNHSGDSPLDQVSKKGENNFLRFGRWRPAIKNVSADQDAIHSVSARNLKNFA